MSVKTLEDLFVLQLSDMYSAEKQLIKALPKMAKAAEDQELAQAFEDHLEETREQATRLEQVIELCGFKLKRKKCEAMEGLVNEGAQIIEEIEKGAVRDTALISAAQKVEHYEIAGYLSLMKLAREFRNKKAFSLLQETLEEEEDTDERLSYIGDQGLREQSYMMQDQKDRMQDARLA